MMSKLPLIMFEACDDYGAINYDTSKPFRRGLVAYATNGHIIVRCSAVGYDAEPAKGKRFVNPLLPWQSLDFAGVEWTPIPECVERVPCDHCDGEGTFTGLYLDAEGDMAFPLRHNGDDVTIDCPECEGAGTRPSMEPVLFPLPDGSHAYFAARYLGMLRRHGVADIQVVTRPDGEGHTARFVGPGFDGLLMGMDVDLIDRTRAEAEARAARGEGESAGLARLMSSH